MLPLALTVNQVFDGLLYAVVFVTLISILVAAHEYGHYIVARACKMGVEEFSIGFGKPKLGTYLRKTYDTPTGPETTDFTLRAWPIGGFVRVKGMVPEEDGSEVNIPGGFYAGTPFQRFLVLLAGPAFSLLAGFLILLGYFATWGVAKVDQTAVIGGVAKDGPAYAAGLRPGDRILELEGKPVAQFYEVVVAIRDRADIPMKVVYERDGDRAETTVTAKRNPQPTPVLGPDLEPTSERRLQAAWQMLPSSRPTPVSFGEATVAAMRVPVAAVGQIVGTFVRPQEMGDSLAGPVGLVTITASAVDQGLQRVIELAALLSISFGILNLLPIHPLDGGQIVVAIAEMLRKGRRLSFRTQVMVANVGMVLVLMLFATAIFNDARRLVQPKAAVAEEGILPARDKER